MQILNHLPNMDQLIRKITKKCVAQLPQGRTFYNTADLAEIGLPKPLLSRVRIEMAINLRESLQLPDQEWLDTDAPEVRHAWDQFTETVKEFGKIPAAHIESVLELSLHDVIGLLVQPHKTTLDLLFGLKSEASEEDLLRRSALITVNRYLVMAMFRYMEKKERTSVRRDQCLPLFQRVDERRFGSFHALDWVRHFDLLFGLMDGQIDTDLMRIFFEEQQMHRVAKRFDLAEAFLSKTGMIELLSSPDLLKHHSYEEDQAALFDAPGAGVVEGEVTVGKQVADAGAVEGDDERAGAGEVSDRRQVADGGESAGAVEGAVSDEKQVAEQQTGEDLGLTVGESYQSGVEGVAEEGADMETHQPVEHEEEEEYEVQESSAAGEVADDFVDADDWDEADDAASEEAPIWRRFLESEESEESEVDEGAEYGGAGYGDVDDGYADGDGGFMDADAGFAMTEGEQEGDDADLPGSSVSDEDDEGFGGGALYEQQWDEEDEEMGIDAQEGGKETDADAQRHAEALYQWLQLDADRFVDEVFGGAEDAYEQALSDIAAIRTWKKATEYIEKEVFNRNRIDMYDEVAVDLTDQLHSYFLEHK